MMSFRKSDITGVFLSVCLGLFLWMDVAYSQDHTDESQINLTVKGTITAKSSESGIEGASVRLYETFNDNILTETTTNAEGGYTLSFSLPQTEAHYHYRIEAEADGLAYEDIVLIESETVQKDLTLQKVSTNKQAITITSIEELQKIGSDSSYPFDGNYTLGNDIDASKTAEWNNGKGFNPITSFTGTFDGNGHTITGLTINRPEENGVGLISTSRSAIVKNVTLENASVTGNYGVGPLVATNNAFAEIDNCHTNNSTASGNAYVGGLAGLNNFGIIKNSSASGSAEFRNSGKGANHIGGITGRNNHAKIHNSKADVNISVQRANQHIGGFVGSNHGEISNSGASGDVTNQWEYGWFVGGFVGLNQKAGTIINSYSTGNVTGGLRVGGFAGANLGLGAHFGTPVQESEPVIKRSYSTGDLTSDGGIVGGFVGETESGIIKNSFARGSVTVDGDADTGGFVGTNGSKIHKVYATGTVSTEGNTAGIAGSMSGDYQEHEHIELKSSYWDTEASKQSNAAVDIDGNPVKGLSAKGLTSQQMKGENARKNMTWFDFESTWKVVEGDYPTLQWEEK